jgi:hypothetical protein
MAWGEPPVEPPPPPPPAIPEGAVDMGEPVLNRGGTPPDYTDDEGSESQAVWDISGGDLLDDLCAAEYLVIETENAIAGGMQLVWQPKNTWSWNQCNFLTNTGASDEKATVSEDGKKVTIELSKALDNYSDFATSVSDAGVKIVLSYFSGENKMAGLGIKVAYLILAEGDFTPHVIDFGDNNMKVEVAWNDDLSPVIVGASNDSYFEVVFSTGDFNGGFGHFATYPGSLSYSEVKYLMQSSAVSDNKFTITKGDLVAGWQENKPEWDGTFNSVQIELFETQTSAHFESITFYEAK